VIIRIAVDKISHTYPYPYAQILRGYPYPQMSIRLPPTIHDNPLSIHRHSNYLRTVIHINSLSNYKLNA